MEENYKNDFKNIIQFNLVPKVEPDDVKFVLHGEFVDTVASASTTPLLCTKDDKGPLSEGITADNPFGLKELKIIAKDCLKELATIKTDVKDESEEDIYDDSLASHEVDDPSTDEQITKHQTKAEPRTNSICTLNKARVTEELLRIGLPTHGSRDEQRRRLSNFVKTGNYRPSESETTDPGASATSASTTEDPKSAEAQPRTSWVYALNKARLTEELQKIGLPTKGTIDEQRRLFSDFIRRENYQPIESKTPYPKSTEDKPRSSWIYALNKASVTEELRKVGLPTKGNSYEQRRLLSNFIKTGYRPTESKTTDPGASATSTATLEDPKSAIDVSLSFIPTASTSKGEQRSSQSNSAPLLETTSFPAKERKKRSYNYEDTSSSESDCDESWLPQRSLRISASSKKTSTVTKENSNKHKKLYLKTVVPDKEKLTSDSPHINGNALKTPLNLLQSLLKSLPLPEKASLPVARYSYGDKAEVHGVLWSCCEMQFELFSTYNNHKTLVHLIDELKCSFCIEKSFSSSDEIEKHYLDVHIDSSWTSFHCLDCRLVFGVKSSFFYHKAKCCESQSVCSGILDSILDFAATRKTSKNLKVNEDTAFRLSCCENIIENFEDFFVHKFSDHNIPLLTCGLCLCVKDTETQLRSHYRQFHFFKSWNRMELKKRAHQEKGTTSTVSSSTQIEDVLIKTDEGRNDRDNEGAKPVQCSALQNGILCQCCDCTKLVEGTKSSNGIAIALNKPVQCELCNLRFHYKSELKKHLRTHVGIKPFPCDICGSAFTQRSTLKKHKLRMHSSNRFQKICSICDKVLNSSLKSHIARVHMRVAKNIRVRCEHCEKTFAKRWGYLTHIRTVHSIGEELICDHCNSVFYDKQVLINHIQSMHLPNEKYECQKCNRNFKSEKCLHSHNKNVHSHKKKDRQFTCEVCGKMFGSNARLKRHMLVHSDDKQFICQTCGKAFKRDVNLQQHQYTHSDSRPHVCSICGQSFRLRTHVKQHMAVHGVIKNRKCLICEKTFARNAELKCHLSTHGI